MARIRTIKPDFFTSEDIVALSPLARLLYVALWCEADKEGRFVWKPFTFKLRYLPGDNCDVQALCSEILERGLVELYGDGYAVIPKFANHQHINPRESESVLPSPTEKQSVPTRKARVTDASPRVPDAQVGREGKGKEGKGKVGERVSEREPPDPTLHPANAGPPPTPEFLEQYREVIAAKRPDLSASARHVWLLFCEHYTPEKRGIARWTKWVLNEKAAGREVPAGSGVGAVDPLADPDSRASVEAVGLSVGMGRWDGLQEPFVEYKKRVRNATTEVEKCS